MGSLSSKDTVEVANPAVESAAPKASAATRPTAGLRQDALSLEVPVKVHGSRVTDPGRGAAPRTDPFEEQTSTMIIFPQGGVLRLSMSVNTGQMLVLTNLKTKQDAICRVVKVRTFTNMQSYVEVEFTHPQPTYWGVSFPGQPAPVKPGAAAPSASAPAAPAHSEVKPKSASDVSWAPAATPASVKRPAIDAAKEAAPLAPAQPKPYVPPSKPTSTFIAIGSQEKEVQPAAAATTKSITAAPPEIREVREIKPVAKEPVAPVSMASETSALSSASGADAAANGFPSLTMTELLGDADAAEVVSAAETAHEIEESVAALEEKPTTAAASEVSRSTFGGLSGGATLDSGTSAASETFGSRFDSGARVAGAEESKSSSNWMLIAAAIGTLVVVGGLGAFFLRGQRVGTAPVAAVPASTSSSAPAAPVHASQPAASEVVQAEATNSPAASPSNVVVAPHGNNAAATANKPNVAAAPSQAAVAHPSTNATVAPAAPQPNGVTGNMVAESLNAHPVAARRSASSQDEEAPSVDAAPSAEPADNGNLPAILSSGDGPAAPEVKPEAPAKVGGNVVEPKLISSPPPIYPVIAKQAHVEGDVVIKTTIDQRGNVTHMEVVSGPPMLRGAALEALKRWKYAPSKLNGEPITVQMLVTLKFHM